MFVVEWRSFPTPVPAEVVNQMGADLCIAVNVVPALIEEGVENAVSHMYRNVNRFNTVVLYWGSAACRTCSTSS